MHEQVVSQPLFWESVVDDVDCHPSCEEDHDPLIPHLPLPGQLGLGLAATDELTQLRMLGHLDRGAQSLPLAEQLSNCLTCF